MWSFVVLFVSCVCVCDLFLLLQAAFDYMKNYCLRPDAAAYAALMDA